MRAAAIKCFQIASFYVGSIEDISFCIPIGSNERNIEIGVSYHSGRLGY